MDRKKRLKPAPIRRETVAGDAGSEIFFVVAAISGVDIINSAVLIRSMLSHLRRYGGKPLNADSPRQDADLPLHLFARTEFRAKFY